MSQSAPAAIPTFTPQYQLNVAACAKGPYAAAFGCQRMNPNRFPTQQSVQQFADLCGATVYSEPYHFSTENVYNHYMPNVYDPTFVDASGRPTGKPITVYGIAFGRERLLTPEQTAIAMSFLARQDALGARAASQYLAEIGISRTPGQLVGGDDVMEKLASAQFTPDSQ